MVRIVSWNVQHGRRPDGAVDVPALVAACASFDADVLALQEVDRNLARSGVVDEAAEVAGALGMSCAFGEAMPGYGNALLARAELEDVEVLALPHDPRREPRCAVLAIVAGVAVACCHLGLRGDAREQLPVVLAALARRPAPRLLAGDLNLRDPDAGVLQLVGGGPTYPAHRPRRRIDHVVVDGLTVQRSAVLRRQPVSDHRPLLVELH